jgi:hypothetical protein
MTIKSNYFYGHEVSEYGLKNHRVDYRTLASAFDAVLNNDIMRKTMNIGWWDIFSGNEEYYEYEGDEYSYNELDDLRDEYDDESEEYEAISEALNNPYYHDIFQYYIVSDNGAQILAEAGEIVFYNEELDMYIWGVTHYGTAWDYVLTNIEIIEE